MRFLILLLPFLLHAVSTEYVKKEASKYTKYPSTIAAIIKVESQNGKYIIGDEGRSLGIAQIQVKTAKYLAKRDPSLTWMLKVPDLSLRTMLIRNDRLSIEICSKLFEYYRKKHGYFQAISRYNGGTQNYTYFNKVQKEKTFLWETTKQK